MSSTPNAWLIAAAVLNALAAVLHLAIIVAGESWYRFFGAGERMAELAAKGHWYPAILTSLVALVLAVWSLYALSGAGVVRPLPLLRTALCLITAVFLLRALAGWGFPLIESPQGAFFWLWTSVTALGIGLVLLAGLLQVWDRLA